MDNFGDPLTYSSTTMRLTFVVLSEMAQTIGWIVMKCVTDINVPLKMKNNHFGDPLTFPLAPSSGQNVHFSNTLFHS